MKKINMYFHATNLQSSSKNMCATIEKNRNIGNGAIQAA